MGINAFFEHRLQASGRRLLWCAALLLVTAICANSPLAQETDDSVAEGQAVERMLREQERAFWQAVRELDSEPAYRLYLQKFADAPGTFSDEALRRIDSFTTEPITTESKTDMPPSASYSLTVRSNVYGDTVNIDGRSVGPSGPAPHRFPEGDYLVVVSKPGYQTWESLVTLNEDRVVRAELTLLPEGALPDPEPDRESDQTLGRYRPDVVPTPDNAEPAMTQDIPEVGDTVVAAPERLEDAAPDAGGNRTPDTLSASLPPDTDAACEGNYTVSYDHADLTRRECNVESIGEEGEMQFDEQFGLYQGDDEVALIKQRKMSVERWYWSWAPLEQYLRGGFDNLDNTVFSKPYMIRFGERPVFNAVDFESDNEWRFCSGFVSANVGQVTAQSMVLGIFCRKSTPYSREELQSQLEKLEY